MRRAAGLLLLATIVACGPSPEPRPTAVVLVVGDGMGIAQISFARMMERGPGDRFGFEELGAVGLVSTHSGSNRTTESAAAATAMASGKKTDNKAIGVDLEGRPLLSLPERARAEGWGVGLVTTTSLTHATPAAFYAHVSNRYDDEGDLPAQLVAFAPEVALGGGMGWFLPAANPRSLRSDEADLLAVARGADLELLTDAAGLEAATEPGRPLLGLFAREHLALELDRRREPDAYAEEPTLAAMTTAALDRLTAAGRPFFLLVEGGRVDHAAHSFDPVALAAEVSALDAAVAVISDYRRRHPDTLVVVTADHATGGLAINDYVEWDRLERQRASIEWIVGPAIARDEDGSYRLSAEEALARIAEWTGFDGATSADLERLRAEAEIHPFNAYRELGRLLAGWHGVTWVPRLTSETWGHTGEDVAVFADGPGAERFESGIDNTEIPRIVRELVGWPVEEVGEHVHPGVGAARGGASASN